MNVISELAINKSSVNKQLHRCMCMYLNVNALELVKL